MNILWSENISGPCVVKLTPDNLIKNFEAIKEMSWQIRMFDPWNAVD